MTEAASRRFATVVTASLQEALSTARRAAGNTLRPLQIHILGQEQRFVACAAADAASGAFERIAGLQGGSPLIMSLTYGSAAAPIAVAVTARDFGVRLQRCLLPKHARRLSETLAEGGFLVLIEVRGVAEERSATRTLLQSGNSAVEVHDLDLFDRNMKKD